MSKVVRKTSNETVSADSLERLKRIAEMPDEQIRTDLIPERRFDVALSVKRRKEGWRAGAVRQKKAS